MKARAFAIWAVSVACIFVQVNRAPADDQVVGRLWEIKFEARDAKNAEVRRFRATPDFKVWGLGNRNAGKPRVIGKWSGDEQNVTMEVEVPGEKNGKYELVLVGTNPDRWKGTFIAENGRKRPIKVRLLKD